MGYSVKHGDHVHGHYNSKEEAYAAVTQLCGGTMPPLIQALASGIERYSHPTGEILVIPDSRTPS